jgi:hypothetical protein
LLLGLLGTILADTLLGPVTSVAALQLGLGLGLIPEQVMQMLFFIQHE